MNDSLEVIKLDSWKRIAPVSPYQYVSNDAFLSKLTTLIAYYLEPQYAQLESANPILRSAYYSFALNVTRRIDLFIGLMRSGDLDINDFYWDIVTESMTFARPWMFVLEALDTFNNNLSVEAIFSYDKETMREYILEFLKTHILKEEKYSITNYERSADVFMDIAYDAGWHEKYASVGLFKATAGIQKKTTRFYALRDMSIRLAKISYLNKKEIHLPIFFLLIGFPDVSDAIQALTHEKMEGMVNKSTKDIILALTTSDTALNNVRNNSQKIAQGAISLMGTNVSHHLKTASTGANNE